MSAAVSEKPSAEKTEKAVEPAVESRRIVHPMDRPVLVSFGVDLAEPDLVEEYFEYRNSFGKPGMLDHATLHRLAVEQKRRLRRAAGRQKGK